MDAAVSKEDHRHADLVDRLEACSGAMHAEPQRTWRLDELAKACAMSRTTFAERFKAIAAVSPLTYLTEWRMRLAERALRDNGTSIGALAQSLGYGSESGFSNAFKRCVGVSPKNFRLAQAIAG